MSMLPAHIMFDIFTRFSANTVGQCRCVCKTWCDQLSDPYFIHFHLSRSPPSLIIGELDDFTSIHMVEIDDEPGRHLVHSQPTRTWEHSEKLLLVGSINGLLCLWKNYLDDDTYIINPILREYVLLPKQKNVRKKFQAYVSYGFGLCPSTNQYKVVRIFQGNVPDDPPLETSTYVSECEVYTLGTREWRTIGHVSLLSVGIRPGIFLNGGFHWLNIQRIDRFDLETETFQTLCSAPPPINGGALCWSGELGELGGCLSICDNSCLETEFVIWVMKEYGVKESWSKMFVISRNHIPEWVGYEFVSPVKILKDGSILMLWSDFCFIIYTPRTKAFQQLDIGTLAELRAMNYVPSILSLKNNIVLENVIVF